MKKYLLTIVGLIIAAGLVGASIWFLKPPTTPSPTNIVCTQDAKECPDGSYVSRSGPNCTFAECPTGPSIPSGWAMHRDPVTGVNFQYPDPLPTKFISAQDWPPVIEITTGAAACGSPARMINGHAYCVSVQSEGAAGSTYTSYVYSLADKEKDATTNLRFTLRSPQCANYDDPEKTNCEQERAQFNVDELADRIVTSVQREPIAVPTARERRTLTGTYTCLPHTNTTGPQTMECALGLRVDDTNEYYALDTNILQTTDLMNLPTGRRITVEGPFTSVAELSSDHWQRYPIVGILTVTSVKIEK